MDGIRDRLRRRFAASSSPSPERARTALPLSRETRLPLACPHGILRLERLLAADPSRLAEAARCPDLSRVPPARLVFFDTETTSLGGGAGVLVFMAGVASIEGEEVVLRQHFLPSPGEERAFLDRVHGDLAGREGFVTFCGKAFDRHRIEDRFRFHGLAPVFAGERHLDLLYPFRRLATGLPDHRLRTLEERVLGLRRLDDLPGERAPQAYFDYLAGRGGEIERVFEHNRIDVLSLLALTALLGDPRSTPG